MIAELGLFSLILAFVFSLLLSIIPTIGIWQNHKILQNAAPIYVTGQFIFISIAFVCLTLCFLRDDFTVQYVLANSSVQLPWFYKVCAVWGGHEGSMLLWVVILSVWMMGVNALSRSLEPGMRIRILVVLGWLSVGLILFLLMTSNPFLRAFTSQSEGQDLNPLLQDPGFLFHPPMLYMGYVGFSVAFAFAIAALWSGKIEPAWAKWTRPWTLAAWSCLTAGITLGSWWAYRELGWGGWWFWDPVENASFMPWLVGTALIHSLAVSEKRQQFLTWTLLLAIVAFSLSLMGTFLVRSGVLTSVHAFAVDPQRGLYILIFLAIVIGGSLLLFSCRAHGLQRKVYPGIVSRESALLLNNVFLSIAMLTVLMGTVYPLIVDGLGLGKLSVGAPYFNTVFIPLVIPLFILMGLGIHLRWQQDGITSVLVRLRSIMVYSLLLPAGLLLLMAQTIQMPVYLGLILALWIILSTSYLVVIKLKQGGLQQLSQAFWGMVLAHIGIAVTIIGIAVSSGYGQQADVQMAPGDNVMVAGYKIQFEKELPLIGPNYRGTQAVFIINNGQKKSIIYPEKRLYQVGQMAMTDSAIDVTPFRDLYVALGEPLSDRMWSVRLYYKPLIRWIWAGGFLILAGGLLALSDRRYYREARKKHHE